MQNAGEIVEATINGEVYSRRAFEGERYLSVAYKGDWGKPLVTAHTSDDEAERKAAEQKPKPQVSHTLRVAI